MNPSDLINMLLGIIGMIAGDPMLFLMFMFGLFVLLFGVMMKEGLSVDDKIHNAFSTFFLTVFFFFLLVMSSNGTLDKFVAMLL